MEDPANQENQEATDNSEFQYMESDLIPDRLTIPQAAQRYGVNRDCVYRWLRYLAIAPLKQGTKSYINQEQIVLLDGLKAYIDENGKMEGYLDRLKVPTNDEEPSSSSDLSVIENLNVNSSTTTPMIQQNNPERVDLNDFFGVDLGKCSQNARLTAKETLISDSIAKKMLENPHLIPAEDWVDINGFKSYLDRQMPRKRYSPEELAQLILNKI